jgi:hypothetical protein
MARSITRAARRRDEEDDYEVGPNDDRIPTRSYDDAADERAEERRAAQRTREQDDADERRRLHRRSHDENEDEDERPARRTARSRSRDEDSDKDGREARRSRRSEGAREATSSSIGRGREGLRRHRETHQSGDFPDRFKIDEGDKVLIKFLDEEPFVTYYEHWIDEFRREKGRQCSYICLGDEGSGCPLCDIGDKPNFYALFNVVDFAKPSRPKLTVWYATPNPGGLIEDEINELEENNKKLDDPDRYYAVSKKKGKNGFTNYSLTAVKARDLDEDWNAEPLTSDELADFEKYDDSIVRINKRSELRDIADELNDGD